MLRVHKTKDFNSCTTSFNNLFHCNVGYKKKRKDEKKKIIQEGEGLTLQIYYIKKANEN